MEAKEKAKELFDKYFKGSDLLYHDLSWIQAKECALIAVDEILEAQPSYRYWDTYDDETPSSVTFWNEVKVELEALR